MRDFSISPAESPTCISPVGRTSIRGRSRKRFLTRTDVAEVAVLGVPDPKWGEIGVAVCVPRPGSTSMRPSCCDWLESRVARYKLPRHVFIWDELPKSGYGKITKNLVRDMLEQRGCLPNKVVQG